MSDIVSLAASIVTLASLALQGGALLLDEINNFKDAPKAIQSLKDDVSSTESIINSLKEMKGSDWALLGPTVAKQTKVAINDCEKAYRGCRESIQDMTRHSKEERLSIRDQAKVSFFKERHLKAMTGRLHACKLSLNSAVVVATLYSSVRHGSISEEIKQQISIREAEVVNSLNSTDTQLITTNEELETANLEVAAIESDHVYNRALNVINQMEAERATLECSRGLLEELRKKVCIEEIEKAAKGNEERFTSTVTMGDNFQGVQTGLVTNSTITNTFGGMPK